MRSWYIPRSIGDWTFHEWLGTGSFSKVYRVEHRPDGKFYACKVVPKSEIVDGESARFQREINALAFIRHKNIVCLHDLQQDDENFYLFIDYCRGGELFEYIVKEKHLDEATAAIVFWQICKGVFVAHQHGVAHRDLKPENILVCEWPRQIRVSDFGLCGFFNGSDAMRTLAGSPAYVAPELVLRHPYDGHLSDCWSLGALLYAMVTGEHPWDVENVPHMLRQIAAGDYTFPPHVSAACRDLISKLMCVDPMKRMKLRNVFSHPWMEPARRARIDSTILPPAPKETVPGITAQLSAGQLPTTAAEIVSPFAHSSSGDMPKLIHGSPSSEASDAPDSPMGQPVRVRHNSSALLLQRGRVGRSPQAPRPMADDF